MLPRVTNSRQQGKQSSVASTPTAKIDATSTTSKVSKVQPKKINPLFLVNYKPTTLGTLGTWPPREQNFNDFGNANNAPVLAGSVLDIYSIITGVSAIKATYNAFSIARSSTVIYRAVSGAEAVDIASFGFRNTQSGYMTGKLFAPTIEEAVKFGQQNFSYDAIPNFIMQAKVPNNVLSNAFRFEADGMNAISISSDQLHLLEGTQMNYSPIVKP